MTEKKTEKSTKQTRTEPDAASAAPDSTALEWEVRKLVDTIFNHGAPDDEIARPLARLIHLLGDTKDSFLRDAATGAALREIFLNSQTAYDAQDRFEQSCQANGAV